MERENQEQPVHGGEKDETRAWMLQILVVGIALASKEHRARIDPGDLWDLDASAAVSELRGATKGSAFTCTRKFLDMLGVEWDEKELPVEAVFRKVALDTKRRRVLRHVTEGIKAISDGTTSFHTERFFESIRDAERELDPPGGNG